VARQERQIGELLNSIRWVFSRQTGGDRNLSIFDTRGIVLMDLEKAA
jgi:hypothetical protein